jgi:HD superfamily phosphohydrolase
LLRRLSKTWIVQRLKHIDLSVVPVWLCPNVPTASRYQHSLGVGRLSLLISDGAEDDQLLLTAAATLHDAGNGPFPHISDQLMEEMLGFDHEGAVRFAFESSPTKDLAVLDQYGLDPDEVGAIVKGGHRLSPLVNSELDLDNADNVHRFMTAMPSKLLGEPSYQPVEIAAAMSLETRGVEVSEDLRRRWLRDRETVYRHVWEDRLNMIGWTMLGRAMRIMEEELTPMFFTMTNREAFQLIKSRLPKLANGLKKREYKIILDRKYLLLRGEADKLSDPRNLREIEEELCKETGLEDWSVGLTVDQPLIGEDADHWRVYLAVHRGGEAPKAPLEEMLSRSVPFPEKG